MNIVKPTIVCLHFAGGNCYSFKFLKPYFETNQLVPLELPGRGNRINEPLIRDKREAVNDLLEQFLRHNIKENFIIYGHSMGATLGLLLCEKLQEVNKQPDALVVTGSCGPGAHMSKQTYLLKGQAFKDALIDLGGTPELLLNDEDTFSFFEPTIRADFELLQKDKIEPAIPLSVPIHVVMGSDEEYVKQIENWKRFSTEQVSTEVWSGGHFFIHNQIKSLVDLLKSCFHEPVKGRIMSK